MKLFKKLCIHGEKKKNRHVQAFHINTGVSSNLAVSETHCWFVNQAAKWDPVTHLGVTLGDMVISHPFCILIFFQC